VSIRERQDHFSQLKEDLLRPSNSSPPFQQATSEIKSSHESVIVAQGAHDSSKYQDTIQRLKERVDQLQDRLAFEEKKDLSHPLIMEKSLVFQNTVEVQNRIDSMRLNFDLLEKRLSQQQQPMSQPESGRIYVVSGR